MIGSSRVTMPSSFWKRRRREYFVVQSRTIGFPLWSSSGLIPDPIPRCAPLRYRVRFPRSCGRELLALSFSRCDPQLTKSVAFSGKVLRRNTLSSDEPRRLPELAAGTKFAFVINLRAAKLLSLFIPPGNFGNCERDHR